MKSEREIDVLIAEKVMGHKVWFNKSGFDGQEYPMIPGKFAYDHLPFYSHNISDAWLVVEKFKENRMTYFIGDDPLKEGKHIVVFADEDENSWDDSEETVPLAICIAALKAVGVDVE